jgi:aminoglycoside phosphotransferase (APT) family kinase protein
VTLKKRLRAALADGSPEAIASQRAVLVQTARGLADLHGCGVKVGTKWTFADEMGEVRGRVELLTDYGPELAGAAEPVLARLERIASDHPADPGVPAHRSFRPAQVLIHGSEVGFIDFDSFCQAEPALDLALAHVARSASEPRSRFRPSTRGCSAT